MKIGSVALLFLISFVSVAAYAAESSPVAKAAAEEGLWWIGHALTAVGILIGAAMIVFQLGRQHRNEIRLQTENFKSQLKLQVYQEFSTCISLATDSVGEASMYAFTAPTHVKNYVNQVQLGLHPSPVGDRGAALQQKNFFAADRVVDVVLLIEKYIIIHPELDIFKLALSAASYDVSKAFHELHGFFLQHLPFDIETPNGSRVENIKTFPPPLMSEFDSLTQRYCESVGDLNCYLGDLSIEVQQLLLHGLFANTLPKRRPADPAKKVVTLDPPMVKSLRTYFLKNTEWGKNAVGAMMEVHKEFHH